jgi:acyl carrier protein
MQLKDVADAVRGFIGQRFPAARNLGDDDRLLGSGRLDSLGVLDVVAFLEKEFAITLADDDLVPENFESVRRLAEFVLGKLGG